MTAFLPSLDDDIEVGPVLGVGSGGRVVAGFQRSVGRDVAVKLLSALDELGRERFAREARIMARLSHPGIVTVLSSGLLAGRPALVLERLEGTDLARAIRAVAQRGGAPSAETLADVLGADPSPWPSSTPWWRIVATHGRDLARALDHAHRSGVLHRDVKPSNVLLERDGRVLLTDFGVATDASTAPDNGGTAPGSLAYQAPELHAGGAATVGSDVFALGALLQEWATLERAFAGDTPGAVVRSIDRDGPRALPRGHFPAGLGAILRRALARDPEQRFGTADELARDLDALLEDRPLVARPEGWSRRWARGLRRHRRTSIAVGSLLLVTTVAASAYEWRRVRAAQRVSAAAETARGHLARSLDALSATLLGALSIDLEGEPLIERKRRRLLETGLALTDELAENTQGESEEVLARLRRVRADVLGELAYVELRLGRLAAARTHLEELRAGLDALGPEPRERALRRAAYLGFAIARTERDDERAEREGLAALELLGTGSGAEANRAQRVTVWAALAEIALARGEVDVAWDRAHRGLVEAEALHARAAGGPGHAGVRALAGALVTVSSVHAADRQLEEAFAAAERALEVVGRAPEAPGLRPVEARAWTWIAVIERAQGQPAAATRASRRALDLYTAVLERSPDSLEAAANVARSAEALVNDLARGSADEIEVEGYMRRAISTSYAVLARVPNSTEMLALRARVALQLGSLLWKRGERREGGRVYEAAFVAAEAAADLDDAAHSALLEEAWRLRLPTLLSDRPGDARANLEQYVSRFPASPSVHYDAGALLAVHARRRARAGAPEPDAVVRALEWLERAVDLGFADRRLLQTDSRLADLRARPAFAELLARVPE